MAGSLIGGWLEAGRQAGEQRQVRVADIDDAQLQKLASQFEGSSITTTNSNAEAVSGADLVVIAVKPHIVKSVCNSIGAHLESAPGKPIPVVSVAAGVRCDDMVRWLGETQSGQNSASPVVIRCMPNTPALLGAGITGLFAGDACPAAIKSLAGSVLAAVGEVVWVENEPLLDSVTAVSGSGPAYFFNMMECMSKAGVDLGLDADAAMKLAIETAYGAALMAREGQLPPETLRKNVTSKGGTTAAALASFNNDGFGEIVARGMQAAHDQAVAMADEFGNE